MRLARAERQDMVRMLSVEGMSTRAIAPIVGAGSTTVKRDLAGGPLGPPEPEFADAFVNKETGEINPGMTIKDAKAYTGPPPEDQARKADRGRARGSPRHGCYRH